jgi:iron complex outermembrane receptor protein
MAARISHCRGSAALGFSMRTRRKYRQLGGITSKGVELDARLSPLPGLDLLATWTWRKAAISKDTPAVAGGTGSQGKTPHLVPSRPASLRVSCRPPDGPLAGLAVGAGVRHVGSSRAETANLTRAPSCTLVDVMAGWDPGRSFSQLQGFRLSLNIKNLLGKSCVAGCAGRLTACHWGHGRSAILTVDWRRQ